MTKDEPINPSYDFQPNILWIVAEDLSPTIPAFGDSTVVTPNLDRLADEGVVYDHFFTPHPVCAPARASIITGMYANSIGASHMRTGPWYAGPASQERIRQEAERMPSGVVPYEAVPPPGVKMFTEYLRSAGYYCTNNSKEDYQFLKTPMAWDESSNTAHWKNRPNGRPFFSVVNLFVTHESRVWAKKEDSLWIDENLNVPVPPYLPATGIAKQDIRRMYSNILEMDAQVGHLLAELEKEGVLDSTIVMWYSDHGGPLPRQKRLLYESGVKVPMIIRFPFQQHKGQRDKRMISFIDLASTMLSLANIQPPGYMQGNAFLGSYIRSKEPRYVFGAADRFDGKTDCIRSARDDRYKYIRYFTPAKPMYLDVAYRNQMPIMQELHQLREKGELTPEQALWFREQKPVEELFDTWNDEHELNNLASNPNYGDKLQELRKACDQWIEEIKDRGLKPERELLEDMWPGLVQPATAKPVILKDTRSVSLHCDTKGASIGYKWIGPGDEADQIAWQVYSQPLKTVKGFTLLAVAHRIGYKKSEVVEYSM